MKLYLDTANVKEIREAASLGVLDGVTTNPSLVAKEGREFEAVLHEICEIVKGPVSGEVTATDFAGMIAQGHEIARIDDYMIVKVPLTRDGIRACKALSGESIKVNVTLDPNGMGFTGTFTIDVLTLANVNVLHLSGAVTGHRVLVD